VGKAIIKGGETRVADVAKDIRMVASESRKNKDIQKAIKLKVMKEKKGILKVRICPELNTSIDEGAILCYNFRTYG
jgi:YbbR domain-containing protein